MGAGLFIPDEARVAPEPLLEALRAILAARGVELIDQRLLQPNEVLQDADRLVVAVGAGGGDLRALAPELAVLEPVRGQILAFRAGAGPAGGPTLRNIAGGYLAPQAGGALAGGTMEPGRSDLAPDPATAERLRGQAAALVPALASASATSRVGIRASTPDGLPLVGASATARVLLAAGMRRNGWLLAPLVAEIIAAQVLGEPAPTEAALFEPGRFEA
jgi:glycine oxidase